MLKKIRNFPFLRYCGEGMWFPASRLPLFKVMETVMRVCLFLSIPPDLFFYIRFWLRCRTLLCRCALFFIKAAHELVFKIFRLPQNDRKLFFLFFFSLRLRFFARSVCRTFPFSVIGGPWIFLIFCVDVCYWRLTRTWLSF